MLSPRSFRHAVVLLAPLSRAQSTGFVLPPAPAQCAGKRFVESIKAKPYPNRVKEVFDAAVKACKK